MIRAESRRFQIALKRFDAEPRVPHWWKILSGGLDRFDAGRWFFLLSGRSVLHPVARCWYVTVERI